MKYVCKVSSDAHKQVMLYAKPGRMEYQCESVFWITATAWAAVAMVVHAYAALAITQRYCTMVTLPPPTVD
ncbi:hypothetical protein EVAR_88197_1 [Eumeta japonica]|uniref:Uncharacterized protein n=1 Tax=Eumeta variegata TaxID=151549 RepID=A0A4C1WBI0_EUMVA|nr:hypothetical protein EVAR_88197_1 [Eumeta japonica]